MSGDRPPDGADGTGAAGELPRTEVSPRRATDESTVGLPSSPESIPASVGETDVTRLQPGESLVGRFTILRFIARGGMGAVYEANDVMLRSRVALKVIRGRIAMDAPAMERFRREVLLARRVAHPNVCHVYELYDATTAARVPIHFLTMELLEGETLSQRIARQGRLTTTEALPLVRQLCWGLAAAHTEGVIHRDLKSSNIILVPRGTTSDDATVPATRVVITDFGIARAVQLGNEESTNDQLTGSAIVGTPEYMAPEQVTGGEVTIATDIYALGVVIYEMVTGKLPFTGGTRLAAAAKRLDEAPPRPESTTPGVDARWSATLLRCLAREPAHRFKSALDLLPALERPKRSLPHVATALAVAIALVLATLAVVRTLPNFRSAQPPPPVAVPTAPRRVVAILGFRDVLPPELAWLPTAVSESLGHELAAAETLLRVVPEDRVAEVRRSLGVSAHAVDEKEARERMQGLLAANLLVFGTLRTAADGVGSLSLSVTMVDATTGHNLTGLEEDLGLGGEAMAAGVASVAEHLRHSLGISLSQEQAAILSTSRERNLDATRSYAKGVMSLHKFEYEDARSYFEAALATDGRLLDAQRRLVDTWEHEGNRKKAREAAERIRARPTELTTKQLAETEAKILGLGAAPEKGAEVRKALFDATPDDIELGLGLVERWNAPKTAGAILSRLRELKAPVSDDIRLDLAEGLVAWQLGDPTRAEKLLTRVRSRAQGMGARTELAQALWSRAEMLWIGEGRGDEALRFLQEAIHLLDEAGEFSEAAAARRVRANVMADLLPKDVVLKALEEDAALYRKLGDHAGLHGVLVDLAYQRLLAGDIESAARTLHEALSESEAIGETPGSTTSVQAIPSAGAAWYMFVKGRLAQTQADLEGVRAALSAARTDANQRGVFAFVAFDLEAGVFGAEDRLGEMRETLKKAVSLMETYGDRIDARIFQRGLCELSCDEGRPLEGLDCLAQHRAPIGMGRRWTDGSVLAKCQYLAGDFQKAEAVALEARNEARQWGLYADQILANTYLTRVWAARGQAAPAIASLRSDLAETERKGANR